MLLNCDKHMKIPIPNVIRWYPVLSLVMAIAIIAPCIVLYKLSKADNYVPVALGSAHHLGGDYLINYFYIDKSIGDSVGEGGGGGTRCCVMLPKKWSPKLKVDVRWEVYHLIRSNNSTAPVKAEVEGIYHAQVPVEPYEKPSDFWVHFFPKGRVRIVVSENDTDGELHPTHWDATEADKLATTGFVVKALFTPEELAELEREAARDRKKYGDWR